MNRSQEDSKKRNRIPDGRWSISGGTVSFKYDPFGRRIYKNSTNATSIFAYDGDNLIEESNATGGIVARYAQNLGIDEPQAMTRGGATSFYQADGVGSITSLSDSTGTNAATYTFDSFGNLTGFTGTLTVGAAESYGYDAVGNLTSKTDCKSPTITYNYDQANRLTQKAYPDSSAVSYT